MSKEERITINIAGRNYPLLIESNELESIRDIEKNLKEKYMQISKAYSALETRDHLAMILFKVMKTLVQHENKSDDQTDSALNTIIHSLKSHLK
jgi:cell division protein ZapA (FtsZ GTPase activity inhibitor)